MIIANDLRLGNYVLKSLKSGNGRKIEVKVDINDLRRICEGSQIYNFEPILLTEEMLLRLGFKKTMAWTFEFELVGNIKLVYYLGEKGVSIGYLHYSDFPCKYVHHLQNLVHSLSGKELKFTDNDAKK